MDRIQANRELMKSNFDQLLKSPSDQEQGRPQPPLEKAAAPGAKLLELPPVQPELLQEPDLYQCMKRRRSRRKFSSAELSLEQLSFLLWASQGVQRVFGDNFATFRPVPSGGARHPFETYLAVNRVQGLTPGLYRYLTLAQQLELLTERADLAPVLAAAALGQAWVGAGAVVLIWSCLPYRGEWRYGPAAHKTMLIDAGHLGQNLYLACEALGCGCCTIGAYDQTALDRLLNLDGQEEFVVYLATVGRV